MIHRVLRGGAAFAFAAVATSVAGQSNVLIEVSVDAASGVFTFEATGNPATPNTATNNVEGISLDSMLGDLGAPGVVTVLTPVADGGLTPQSLSGDLPAYNRGTVISNGRQLGLNLWTAMAGSMDQDFGGNGPAFVGTSTGDLSGFPSNQYPQVGDSGVIYVGVTTSQGVIGRWLVVVPEPGVGLAVLGALALMVGRRDRR